MVTQKNFKRFNIFLFLLMVFSSINFVSAAEYTVTSTNQFTNVSGEAETVTIGNPIQSAIDSAVPGDIITVNPSEYNVTVNVTKNNLIIRGSTDGGRVNITSPNNTAIGFIFYTNQSDIIIANFTIKPLNKTVAILVHGNNVTIKNNIFYFVGNATNDVETMNDSMIRIDSVFLNISLGWIINNTFKNISGTTSQAISIIASNNNISNILIENNSIQGRVNATGYSERVNGIFLDGRGRGIMLYSISIKHNVINITENAIIISNATSINISHNFIINTSQVGISLRGFKNGTTSAAANFDEFFIKWNNFTLNGGPSIYLCNVSGDVRTGNGNITTVRNKIISYNSFQGTNSAGAINNSCTDANVVVLNLTFNYWNSVNGPGNVTYTTIQRSDGRNISGGNLTNYAPWYDDASRTILHSITNGTAGQYFSTLQDAVDSLNRTDTAGTITLGNGTYEAYLNLTLFPRITIKGANPEVTKIQGNRTFIISLGNNSVIDSVRIIGNGSGYGIIAGHNNFSIKNTHFSDSRFATYVGNSSVSANGYNISIGNIVNNTIWNATGYAGAFGAAITLRNSLSNNIRGVTVANNSIYNATTAIDVISDGQGQGGIVSEIIITSNHIRNISHHGIAMYNVSAINVTNNRIANVSKNSILITGFRNSSLNEFFITWNNFSYSYADGLYSIIQVCNDTIHSANNSQHINLTDISKKIISYNSFVGAGTAVNSSCLDLNLSLNLTFNYWNSATGPGNISGVRSISSGLNFTLGGAANNNATIYAPWAVNINRSKFLVGTNIETIAGAMSVTKNNTVILVNNSATAGAIINITRSGAANTSLNFAAFLNSTGGMMTNGSLNITINTTVGVVQLRFPPSFNITPSNSVVWSGNIYLANVQGTASVTPTATSGYTQAVVNVYEIGDPDTNLTMDRGVRINLSGQGANYVGYSQGATHFTEITTACTADNQSIGDELSAGGNCKITKGSDLIIWTKHFSKFSTYTKTATAAAAASSSSSGSGSSAVTTNWTSTYIISNEEFTAGYTKDLGAKARIKVKIDNKDHYVGVKSLTATQATIEISSEPVAVELDIGEEAKADVNDDGTYDIYVKLDSIANNKATVFVKKIAEQIPEGGSSVSTTGEQVTPSGEEEAIPPTEEKGKLWVWIIIIIVIAIVIAVGIKLKKRR